GLLPFVTRQLKRLAGPARDGAHQRTACLKQEEGKS
ncbi:ABC transporter permease, partial [bacterium M00.F.Ca.ET.199.01.1.1]